jgi:predicted nucleic acid-binding protein
MNATGSVLVDTSIVVDYLRQDLSLHKKVDRIEDVYLPLAVLGELRYGAYKSRHTDKALAQAREFSHGCIVIRPDEATAELYYQIKAVLAASGRDRHFSFIAGMTILDWQPGHGEAQKVLSRN